MKDVIKGSRSSMSSLHATGVYFSCILSLTKEKKRDREKNKEGERQKERTSVRQPARQPARAQASERQSVYAREGERKKATV